LVAQSDLAPTLLDLAGIAAGGMDGTSLRASLDGKAPSGTFVYSETLYPRYHFGWSELFAVTESRYRYIRAPRPELFDVSSDPRETTNIAADRQGVIAGMERWRQPRVAAGAGSRPVEVPCAVRERLEALGGAGGGSGGGE